MNPFNIIQTAANEISEIDKSKPLQEQIQSLLSAEKVVLFMKGNTEMPQCGFSANTSAILKQIGVPFKTFNILADQDIRQGLKEFSNWPTYPQLYVNGQLVGGNDIVTEMFQNGELQKLING
jgi:monothiol glutaredoxin